jgi:hypothetical protein
LTNPLPVLPPISKCLSGRLTPNIHAKTGDKSTTQLGLYLPDKRNKAGTDNHLGKSRPHHVTVIRHQLAGLHHTFVESIALF